LTNRIKDHAKEAQIPLDENTEKSIQSHIVFLQKREDASATMAKNTGDLADRKEAYAVAMNIGAAHTTAITRFFQQARRPYAVITPAAIKQTDMPDSMLKRKYDGSAASSRFEDQLAKAVRATSSMHPELVLAHPERSWFPAKGELYNMVDQLAHQGSGGGPGGGNGPSGSFGAPFGGDPNRKVRIDNIEPITGSSGSGSGGFTAEVHMLLDGGEKSFWIRVEKGGEVEPSRQTTVEEILLQDHDGLEAELKENKVKNVKEAEAERVIQVSSDVCMLIGKSKAEVTSRTIYNQ